MYFSTNATASPYISTADDYLIRHSRLLAESRYRTPRLKLLQGLLMSIA